MESNGELKLLKFYPFPVEFYRGYLIGYVDLKVCGIKVKGIEVWKRKESGEVFLKPPKGIYFEEETSKKVLNLLKDVLP